MTILAESVDKQFTFLGCVLLLIGITCIVSGLVTAIQEGSVFILVTVILLIIGATTLAPAIFVCRESHKQLKVMLSEDYPAADLLDKYEIEGRDGKIWVITEKAILEEEEEK